jgi:hypothetical protein
MTQIQWQQLESMIGAMTPEERQRLATILTSPTPAASDKGDDPWIGAMADDAELLDQVMEGVYRARETHPLRIAD